jgi:glycosyltransferase involved in cell wall biosynthesis
VIAEDFPDLVFPWITERALWTLKSALAHRRANDIVTVSEHAKRGIVRRFGHSPDRIWVVDEAPDPLFRRLSDSEIDGKIRARLGLSPPERFIVYLGGMNPHKNLGSLLESLSVLERAGRLRGIKLVLVGETETELFTPGLLEVRERVTSLGLSRHVQFTGYLEEEDVVQLLNAADFLVLPSFAEGFGLPAVESAACGTPVIATTNSPLPELLKGGGLFVDPGKPQELTLALARMLSDHDERRRLGRMALKQAGRLTWQRSAGQFLARLEGLPRLS